MLKIKCQHSCICNKCKTNVGICYDHSNINWTVAFRFTFVCTGLFHWDTRSWTFFAVCEVSKHKQMCIIFLSPDKNMFISLRFPNMYFTNISKIKIIKTNVHCRQERWGDSKLQCVTISRKIIVKQTSKFKFTLSKKIHC